MDPDDTHATNGRIPAATRTITTRRCFQPPNGQRISGERRAEGDERVRCMRVLGSRHGHGSSIQRSHHVTASTSTSGTSTSTSRLTQLAIRVDHDQATRSPTLGRYAMNDRPELPTRSEALDRLVALWKAIGGYGYRRHYAESMVTQTRATDRTGLCRPVATTRSPVAISAHLSTFRLPNGQRISGERRAEGDERVRCMRVLGSVAASEPAPVRLPFKPTPPKGLSSSLPKAPPFRLFAYCQGGP